MATNTTKNYLRVRIGNADDLTLINDLVKTERFKSKNEVVNQAIKIGLPVIYKQCFGKQASQDNANSLSNQFAPNSEIRQLCYMVDELSVVSNIIEYLCATIYNVLLAQLKKDIITPDDVLTGGLSDLPQFLMDIKDELIKRHAKKRSE